MKKLFLSILLLNTLQIKAQTAQVKTSAWQDLQQQINNSTIVGLGETSDGYATINEAKSFVATLLHDSLHFSVIAFESSLTESLISYLNQDSFLVRSNNFLYPFWNTPTVQESLKLFYEKEKQAAIPLIAGFDIQEDCRFITFSAYLLRKDLITINTQRLLDCDSVLSFYIGETFSRNHPLIKQEYDLLTSNYTLIATELKQQELNAATQKILQYCIQNRLYLCKYLTLSKLPDKMHYRDSLMALNIKWLKDEIFHENKLIVWAANTHIAKLKTFNTPEWMGEWLSVFYPATYYAISFEQGDLKNRKLMNDRTAIELSSNKKGFNYTIFLKKLDKINPEDWITKCK